VSLTLAAFRVEYPEFVATADATVEAKLAAALARTDADAFGDDADAAQGLLAAHLLASSPYGQTSRQEGADKSSTTYLDEWKRLARSRCGGPRIARTS
jgi:hypothetical protein